MYKIENGEKLVCKGKNIEKTEIKNPAKQLLNCFIAKLNGKPFEISISNMATSSKMISCIIEETIKGEKCKTYYVFEVKAKN